MTSPKPPITVTDLSAERPILGRSDDLLDRSAFADHIANAVRGWTGQDSLVISLDGSWGTGKSSLKNLILESLRSEAEISPRILEFNPWQWAGQGQLAQAFFREIGKLIGRHDVAEESKLKAVRWSRYSAALGLGGQIFGAARRLALVSLSIVGLLSFAGGFFLLGVWKIALSTIAALAFLGVVIMESGGQIVQAVANYFRRSAEAQEKTLVETKNDLSDALRSLTKPILVVVDDIDRLTGQEILLLFQLIKVNADFPNLVYLLLFQRDTVEEAISHQLNLKGREYLKKIVQVEFSIPALQRTKVERVLTSRLDGLLAGDAIQKLWNTDRWGDVYLSGIREYFTTLRDVYRFMSSLSFQFAVFSNRNTFEVNPIDLISLEVLRVFEPEVFKKLPTFKSALTETYESRMRDPKREAAKKAELIALVKLADQDHSSRVQKIIESIFPPASWAFDGSRYGSDHSDAWYRDHRACHADVFDKYFVQTIPEGDLSHEELEKVVAQAHDRDALKSQFKDFRERDLLKVAMDRLESYKEIISLEHAVPFCTALFDIGDDLPSDDGGLTAISTDMHALRNVYWVIKREQPIEKRAELLKKCVRETHGVYLPAFVVALESDRQKQQSESGNIDLGLRLANDTDLEELKAQCAKKIKECAYTGGLAGHPQMGRLLGFWSVWSSIEDVKEWINALLNTNDGAIQLVLALAREVKSYGLVSYSYRSQWRIDLQLVGQFVELDVLDKKLSRMEPTKLDEQQRNALMAFTDALQRKREGKPPLSHFDI